MSWHLVGHLQSNKAGGAVELFDLIHAVDRLKLARALDAAAARLGQVQDVLIQINQGGEATKSGVEPEAAPELLQEVARLPHLRVLGLMTMPPWFPDPETARPLLPGLAGTAGPSAGTHRPAPDRALHGHVRRFRRGGGGRGHPGPGGHRHFRPSAGNLFRNTTRRRPHW